MRVSCMHVRMRGMPLVGAWVPRPWWAHAHHARGECTRTRTHVHTCTRAHMHTCTRAHVHTCIRARGEGTLPAQRKLAVCQGEALQATHLAGSGRAAATRGGVVLLGRRGAQP